MTEFVQKIMCPKCGQEMDEAYWDNIEVGMTSCWQAVLFRCDKCKTEQAMTAVYEFKGYEKYE